MLPILKMDLHDSDSDEREIIDDKQCFLKLFLHNCRKINLFIDVKSASLQKVKMKPRLFVKTLLACYSSNLVIILDLFSALLYRYRNVDILKITA